MLINVTLRAYFMIFVRSSMGTLLHIFALIVNKGLHDGTYYNDRVTRRHRSFKR